MDGEFEERIDDLFFNHRVLFGLTIASIALFLITSLEIFFIAFILFFCLGMLHSIKHRKAHENGMREILIGEPVEYRSALVLSIILIFLVLSISPSPHIIMISLLFFSLFIFYMRSIKKGGGSFKKSGTQSGPSGFLKWVINKLFVEWNWHSGLIPYPVEGDRKGSQLFILNNTLDWVVFFLFLTWFFFSRSWYGSWINPLRLYLVVMAVVSQTILTFYLGRMGLWKRTIYLDSLFFIFIMMFYYLFYAQ